MKSFWLVESRTGCPRREFAGGGCAAGDMHSTRVALFHTPAVSMAPILHRSVLVFAKFLPVIAIVVPPAEFPNLGDTEPSTARGVY